MQNQRVQRNNRWLGIGFIVVAVLIMSIGFAGVWSGSYGHVRYGASGFGPHGYGHHMPGYGLMWHGLTGMHPMRGSELMMRGLPMMPGFDFTSALDLAADQEQRIAAIREQIGESRRDLLERLGTEQRRLVELLDVDDPDPAPVGAQFARTADLKRQLLELGLDERRRIGEVLSSEQRDDLRKFQRAWMINGDVF